MKRIISALMMITVASIAMAGCGGDDDDDSSNTSGGQGNSAGAPVTDNGGAPPSTGNVECDETLDGVCQNPTDCPGVASGQARGAAAVCGLGECISAKDSACAIACIVKSTGMTDDCADCYGTAVACAVQNCLAECMAPESDECKIGQVEKGCRDAFNTCSGLPE